jgi:hypothetical protein
MIWQTRSAIYILLFFILWGSVVWSQGIDLLTLILGSWGLDGHWGVYLFISALYNFLLLAFGLEQ